MIKTWSKAGVRPEKFTGEKTQNILTKEELGGGFIAWAKKVAISYVLMYCNNIIYHILSQCDVM